MAFITLEMIAKKMLPRLMSNLVMPNLCYKDYSNEFVSGLGEKIQVKLPMTFDAHEFSDGNTVTKQQINEQSKIVELNKMADVTVEYGSLESAMNMSDAKFNEMIDGMAVAIAEKINADGLKMVTQCGKVLGTKGTTPDGLDDFSAIRKEFNVQKAPLKDRYAVWSPNADAEFTQLGNLVKVCESGSPDALREGEIGRVYGLDNYMAQDIYESSATKIITGSGAVTYSQNTAGDEITLTYATSVTSTTLAKGDIVKFTGSGSAVAYCGVKSVAVDTSAKTVKITVYQPVSFTVTGHALNESCTWNLAFQKDAIAFVTRPLTAPKGVDAYTVNYNGLGLRLVRDYDMETKKELISADILYNYEVIRPEHVLAYVE